MDNVARGLTDDERQQYALDMRESESSLWLVAEYHDVIGDRMLYAPVKVCETEYHANLSCLDEKFFYFKLTNGLFPSHDKIRDFAVFPRIEAELE